MWAFKNKDSIFFLQDKDDVIGYSLTLGIQIQWQYDIMLKWSNRSYINERYIWYHYMKYHLFTLLFFIIFVTEY